MPPISCNTAHTGEDFVAGLPLRARSLRIATINPEMAHTSKINPVKCPEFVRTRPSGGYEVEGLEIPADRGEHRGSGHGSGSPGTRRSESDTEPAPAGQCNRAVLRQQLLLQPAQKRYLFAPRWCVPVVSLRFSDRPIR